MRILVCGDRNWTNYYLIHRELGKFPAGTVLIHGDARGADRLAGQAGLALGFKVTAIPAEWDKYGRAAGPKRNAEMLDLIPDMVLAFHDDIEASKGTRNCLDQAADRHIPATLIGHTGRTEYGW